MPIIPYNPLPDAPFTPTLGGASGKKDRDSLVVDPTNPKGRLDITDLRESFAAVGIIVKPGLIESYNFVAGVSGWQLKADGTITGVTGSFGGWSITAGYIYSLLSGTPTSSPTNGVVIASTNAGIIVYEGANKRVELGYLSAGVYGLRGYATDGTTIIFEFSDTRQMIGGWNFTDTVLRSGSSDALSNVLIDAANSLLRLGPTAGNYLTLDGANQRVRSSNYSAGVAGVNVDPALVEAENLVARGIMRGSTFMYDVISAVGGQLMIANSDTLASDMTALDASTLTTRGNVTWAVNDMIVIRSVTALGIQEEWLRVTAIGSAPTYAVTRDLAGSFAANTNPIWQAGTTIVRQGSSDGVSAYSGGWLRLFGEGTNSPYYSVFSRTGVAYNAYAERVRLGNLNGIGGVATDAFGIFMGNYSARQYAIYDDVSGKLKINGLTIGTGFFGGDGSDGAVDGSGNVTITGSNNTLIVKQYTSWAAGSRTLTVTPTGCVVIIKIQGDCDLTNWTCDFDGKGNAGGAGGAGGSAAGGGTSSSGSNGTASSLAFVTGAGTGGVRDSVGDVNPDGGGGGGGGASIATSGSNGTTNSATAAGTGGSKQTTANPTYMQLINAKIIGPGAGGGGGAGGGASTAGAGGNTTPGNGAAGGAGGGCVIFQVGGNLTFSGTTLSARGAAGSNGTTPSPNTATGGGGGGGGGGGCFCIFYNGTLTGSNTPTVTGGAGGTGGSAAGGFVGGNGGDGGAGLALVEKNTAFA